MAATIELRDHHDVDVCILGAGPHGLAAAIHLTEADPDLQVVNLDPSGAWLSTWHSQMRRSEIPTLRSPFVHTPSPDPSALARHMKEHQLASSGLPYEVPTVEAFAHFCDHLIDTSELRDPIAAEATDVEMDGDDVVVSTSGPTIRARHLVVATNPHRRHIPDWVWPILGHRPGLVDHVGDLDLADLPDLAGEAIVIIGGGLSAAHLACGAVERGGHVHLVARRELTVRSFDTDPGWLGPKLLCHFEAEPDPSERLRMAREARGGGTIPPWMRNRLYGLVGAELMELHECAQVEGAQLLSSGQARLVLNDLSTLDADRIWLATGTSADIASLHCLSDLVADLPVLDGLPIPDEDLRIGDMPVHVTGRLATLVLGPAAGNLWGAQNAARLITAAITDVVDSDDSRAEMAPAAPEAAERSSTNPTTD